MSYMTSVKGATPGSLREFIKCGLLTVASQPKNNAVDLDNISLLRLYVFLIDHDYPGGSAAMHNAVFDAYGLPYRSCFMIGDPARAGESSAYCATSPSIPAEVRGPASRTRSARFSTGSTARPKPLAASMSSRGIRAVSPATIPMARASWRACSISTRTASRARRSSSWARAARRCPSPTNWPSEAQRKSSILNRTIAKAAHVAQFIAPFCAARAAGEEVIGGELADAGIVVNTSNKGAQPNEKFSAFAPMTGDAENDLAVSFANLAQLPSTAIVADILLEAEPLTLKLAASAATQRIAAGT